MKGEAANNLVLLHMKHTMKISLYPFSYCEVPNIRSYTSKSVDRILVTGGYEFVLLLHELLPRGFGGSRYCHSAITRSENSIYLSVGLARLTEIEQLPLALMMATRQKHLQYCTSQAHQNICSQS
jgi:hypothetical protein